jgi:TP901 family phage tail tape measure protein
MAANIRAGRAFVEMTLDGRNKFKSDLARAGAQLKKFGQSAKSVGKNLLAMGTAAAVPLALSAKSFAEFDDKMRAVKAITGSTAEDFEKLTAEAKRLGSTTRFSASEAAEGMRFLGMAGFNTEQIMKGLPSVLALAAAGAVELGMAADIVSDVGSAFGLTADEAGRVADVIATTATSANTSIEMMGESFKHVAPIAKAAGQTIEETSAAIGLLGNSGIKASSAGTQLTEILAAMGGKSTAGLKALGVEVKNVDGTTRPLLDVMRDVGDATRNMDGLDRLNTMMTLFGTRGGKAAIILADAGNAADEMRGKMANAEGKAAKMAATMEGGIGGAFRSMKSAVEGAGIAMGTALAPMLTIVAALIKTVAQFLAKNQGLAKVLGVVAIGLLVTGGALVAFGSLMTLAGTAATAFTTIMSVLTGIMAVLTSPITAVVVLIGLLGGALLYFTGIGGKVLDWLGKKFDRLKKRVMSLLGLSSKKLKAEEGGTLKELTAAEKEKLADTEKASAELRLKSAELLKEAINAEGAEREEQRKKDLTSMSEANFGDVNANLGKNAGSESTLGTFSPLQASREAVGMAVSLLEIAGNTEKIAALIAKAKAERIAIIWR